MARLDVYTMFKFLIETPKICRNFELRLPYNISPFQYFIDHSNPRRLSYV